MSTEEVDGLVETVGLDEVKKFDDYDDEYSPLVTSDGYNRYTLNVALASYEGGLLNGLCHGRGRATFKGGQSYVGEFRNGSLHGQGEYRWPDNATYVGELQDGKITGTGKYTWADGSSYEGEVVNGFRHGQGIFVNPNIGAKYEGSWERGLRHGQGTLYYDNSGKSFYNGEWLNGQRHGHGRLQYSSGNEYVGEWQYDRKHGHGTMHWRTLQQRYVGQWDNDEASGSGDYVWEDVAGLSKTYMDPSRATHLQVYNRYLGEMKHGVRHGNGTFFSSNGSVFRGSYDGNRKQGPGVYVFENGTKYVGDFEMDRMVHKELWTTQDTSQLDLDVVDLVRTWATNVVMDGDHHVAEEDAKAQIESLVEKEKRRIDNVLLRFYDPILEMYRHYCKFALDGEVGIASLRMNLYQTWQFLDDCGMFSAYLTRADVDRLVLHHMINDEDCPTKALSEHIKSVHDPRIVLLVREFAEVIVRVAYYANQFDPRFQTSLRSASFSELCKQFFEQEIIPKTRTHAKAVKHHAYHRPIVQRLVVRNLLAEHDEALRIAFHTVAKPFIDVSRGKYFHPVPDHTMTMRQLAIMLRNRGVLTENIPLRTCLEWTKRHEDDDIECHMESEVIFAEFGELIVSVGLRAMAVEKKIAEKAAARLAKEEEIKQARAARQAEKERLQAIADEEARLAAEQQEREDEEYARAHRGQKPKHHVDKAAAEQAALLEAEAAAKEAALQAEEEKALLEVVEDDIEPTIEEIEDAELNSLDLQFNEQQKLEYYEHPVSQREQEHGLGEWTMEFADDKQDKDNAHLTEQVVAILKQFLS